MPYPPLFVIYEAVKSCAYDIVPKFGHRALQKRVSNAILFVPKQTPHVEGVPKSMQVCLISRGSKTPPRRSKTGPPHHRMKEFLADPPRDVSLHGPPLPPILKPPVLGHFFTRIFRRSNYITRGKTSIIINVRVECDDEEDSLSVWVFGFYKRVV